MWTSPTKASQKIDARGPRFAVFGGHGRQHWVEYAVDAEYAERIRARYEEAGFHNVTVYPPAGSVDLAELGRARTEARRVLDEATATLRAAVLRALEDGRAEAEIARTAGIDRMTVRGWAGKR